MADIKISAIWAGSPAAAFTGATHLEAEIGGLTKGVSGAQIATYIQTALASLTLASGKISLAADGSALFANNALQILFDGTVNINGNATLNPSGSASFASGAIILDDTGFLTVGSNKIRLMADGRAQFSSATDDIGILISPSVDQSLNQIQVQDFTGTVLFAVAATGQVSIGGDVGIGLIQLYPTGAVSFAGGRMVVDASGNATFDSGAGTNVITASGDPCSFGTPVTIGGTINLNPDGSANFGSLVIGGDGSVSVNGGILLNNNGQFTVGSASFDGQFIVQDVGTNVAFQINASTGDLFINGLAGLTQNVTISGTTLHFTNGILTSVT